MDVNFLKQIIDTAEKTGDKIIIADSQKNKALVVMDFNQYQKIISNQDISLLTEEELLQKINRDIAEWKNLQEPETIDSITDYVNLEEDNSDKKELTEEKFYIEPIE